MKRLFNKIITSLVLLTFIANPATALDFRLDFSGFGTQPTGISIGVIEWFLQANGLSTPPTATTYTGPTAHWVADSTGTLVNQGGLLSGGQKIPPIRGATIVDGVVTAAGDAMVFEAAATNLCLQNNEFDATWTANELTVDDQAAVAPDGTTTADKLIPSIVDSPTHNIIQSINLIAKPYTFSVYAKAGGYNFLAMKSEAAGYVEFNLATGDAPTIVGGIYTAAIEPAMNGWYRCSITYAGTVASYQQLLYVYNLTGAGSYAGDGTSGIYVWGAQVNLGSVATSPIPTTTAAVTRPATDLAIPTPLALSDPSGFQMRCKFTPKALPGSDQVLWYDATSGAKLFHRGADNKICYFHNAKTLATSAAVSLGTTVDLGIRQTTAGASISLDQTVTTDATMTTIPTFGATLEIGSAANANYFTGEIAKNSNNYFLHYMADKSTTPTWFSSEQ